MNLGLKSEMEEIRNETQKMEIKLEIERQYMKNKTNEENWVEVHNKESGKWTKSGFYNWKMSRSFFMYSTLNNENSENYSQHSRLDRKLKIMPEWKVHNKKNRLYKADT